MDPILLKVVALLGADHFRPVTNIACFPMLSVETAYLLSRYGAYTIPKMFPGLLTDGLLKEMEPGVLRFAWNCVNSSFCIDLNNNEQVVYRREEGGISKVNGSLFAFWNCVLALLEFEREVAEPEQLGPYYENKNYERYATLLRAKLSKHEPDLKNCSLWEGLLVEMELGVI